MSNRLDPLPASSTCPMVSVVMPVRNEGPYISRSLNAVLAQNYPADRLEIIVADGKSTDGTREFIQSLQLKHPNLKLINNPGQIAPTGLNAAFSESKGQIIVRIDGHCEIGRDHLRTCVRLLSEADVDGVGGPIETLGEAPISRVIAVAMSSPFGVGGSAFRTIRDRTMLTDTIAFPAYKRSAMERVGLYDEELVRNQDDEYNYRLRKLGGRLLLSPELPVRYWSRSSLRSLGKQFFQYGFFKVRILQKHPLQMRVRQFVPPLFVAGLAAAIVVMPLYGKVAWLLFSLLGTYGVANLIWTAQSARCLDARLLTVLPLAFAVMHLAYGAGFLAGLVRFCRRWGRWGVSGSRGRTAARLRDGSEAGVGQAPVEAGKR